MGLFDDIIRQGLGFPTRQESLDRNIKNYKLHELQSIEHSMANRNIAISYISEQIRQLEKVIKDNQFFIDAYETIKSKATEKIKEGNNPETIALADSKGNVIIEGNYQVLTIYQTSIAKKGINAKLLSTYTNMLGLAYEQLWQRYANKIILGKGLYLVSGKNVDDCYDIHTIYRQAVSLMNAGRLKNEQREPVVINLQNMPFINAAYTFCMNANGILRLALQELQIRLDKLNSEQATDEYAKKLIEDTKRMMSTTAEYFKAKKSQEYLNILNGMKK